jgi:transporter family-2 protein
VSPGTAFAVVLCAVAGLVGSMQVAVMGRFGEHVGVWPALAFASLLSAGVAVAALLAVDQSLGGLADALRAPPWLWLGGLMGAFIVLTITVAAPRIGTTATIGILIAGQLAMGAVIDRFGLFGVEKIELSLPRLAGLALLAAGAALSLHKS